MGGAAILSNFLPSGRTPVDGLRGLLQMCFSMLASQQGSFQYASPEPNVLIPTRAEPYVEGALPKPFFDWMSMIDNMVADQDRPSADLLKVVARFVQLSALVRTQPLIDGQPRTADVIRQALEIDRDLESWEKQQHGAWSVAEEHVDDFFPSEAVFDGCYHVYGNTYIARVWNHYRWTRIMVNQLLLEAADHFPGSSAPLVANGQQPRSLECIARLARDTLVSVPTHYRHPQLQPAHWEYFDRTKGGAGIGTSGIPTTLFQVKVAGCAPGVPDSYRAWALEMLETAYRDTGMFQGKALAGFLRRNVEEGSSRSASSTSSSSSPSTVYEGS